MKTMESIYVGHKKYRPALTTNSFYQPPLPHTRIPRPQSEYGISGMPWAGYSRGSSGSGSAEWPPWNSAGSRIGTARPRKGRFCSLFLVGGALLALAVVLAVAGLALYMGAFRNDNPDPIIIFEGRLKFRKAVGAGSTTSAPSASRLSTALRQIYVGTPIGPALSSADVLAVNDEKLVAFFRLYLDRRKIPSTIDNLEKTIRNVIIENSILKNSPLRQMNVDPSSISIRRDTEHTESHMQPPDTTTAIPVLPQNAKEKIIETRMGVIRKPAAQSNLTFHKFKSQTTEEPDINFDELPVIQGSYEASKNNTNSKQNINQTRATAKPTTSKEKTTQIPVTTRRPSLTIANKIKNSTSVSPITPRTTSVTNKKSTITTTLKVHSKSENSTQKSVTEADVKTKENLPEYLPKLDSLFVVPSYDDQEPWRPIPSNTYNNENVQPSVELQERYGEVDLVDDEPVIEGVAHIEEVPSSIVPYKNASHTHNMHQQNFDSHSTSWSTYTESPPEPVYTSFTDPGFSSTKKETLSLDMIYPKPHPIPVNKLNDEVVKTKDAGEISFNNFFMNSQSNSSAGESKYTPPKDTLSTVAINVKPLVKEDNVEFINGGVIIRKQNQSTNANKDVESGQESQSFVKIHTSNLNSSLGNIQYEPSLYSPPPKWEFVNGSSEIPNIKKPPNKTFNETLQAVITENKDPVPFKFVPNLNKMSDSKENTRTIDQPFRREETKKPQYSFGGHGTSEPLDLKAQELLLKELMVEQVSHSSIIPTLLPVKSNSGIGRPLRPRPKIPTNNENNGHDRSFSNSPTFPILNQVKNFIQNLGSEETDVKLKEKNNTDTNQTISYTTEQYTTSVKTNIVTSITYTNRTKNYEPQIKFSSTESPSMKVTGFIDNVESKGQIRIPLNFTIAKDQPKRIDISEKFRLPKTHSSDSSDDESSINTKIAFLDLTSTTEKFQKGLNKSEDLSMLKHDTGVKINTLNQTSFFTTQEPENFRIKLNVDSTMDPNESRINNTKNDITNDELLDIIKNLTSLQKNKTVSASSNRDEISPDKLRHLASLATITDSHNNTFFNNDTEDTIISTKAVSSNYKVNNAGFKILTKTFNKIPGNYKDDEKKINKHIEEPFQTFYDNLRQNIESEDCESKNLTVKCSNGQCLPETARCNRLLDCPNGEDELECTCADYLRSQFLIRKLCDGIPDCWDFSDENNCEWCTPNQYVCSNSRQCIDKDKICDGKRDCPLGDDEKQCVTVAMTQDDAKSYPYSKEGYIMVQKNGLWGRLCMQNFDKVVARSNSALQITDLGRAVCKTMTYIDYENVDKVIEDKPNIEQLYYSLHYTSKGDSGRGGLAFRRSSCSRGQVAKVVCSQLQCGARPQAASQQASILSRHSRIVGGGNAGAGSWPWQAALYKEGDFQCGATLISDRWLISAGHCFYHAQEDYWVARLGALRRGTTFPSPYEQLQPISSIILHPGYVDTGFINDIALLKTVQKVAFSDYVRPICLPPHETDMEDGRRCTVIGWGQLFEVGRIFPDTLQEVELPVISTGECRKRTIFLPLYRITDDMFCAGFDRGGRDACLGDSGGPLMCQEQDNQWYLYGVTSNGYGCARANRPGVYTKVANYVNWIQTTMQLYDDRSFEHPHNFNMKFKNSSYSDLDMSESRSLHRHVDKCRGHRCPLGECLPPTRVCNGFMECSDGSDEKNC